MAIRGGINGFGQVGRPVLSAILSLSVDSLEVIA